LPPSGGLKRTNVIQKLFFLSRYNRMDRTGYQVLPSSPGSACVGSLYRFTTTTRGQLAQMSTASGPRKSAPHLVPPMAS